MGDHGPVELPQDPGTRGDRRLEQRLRLCPQGQTTLPKGCHFPNCWGTERGQKRTRPLNCNSKAAFLSSSPTAGPPDSNANGRA